MNEGPKGSRSRFCWRGGRQSGRSADASGYRRRVTIAGAGVRRSQGRLGTLAEETGAGERPARAGGCRPDAGQADPEGGNRRKLVIPDRRRRCVQYVRKVHRVSKRRACQALGQSRTSQRYQAIIAPNEQPMTAAFLRLVSASTGATATGGSPRYCGTKAGM
jgi:hypothetical protein